MIITLIADIYGEENNGTVASINKLINNMLKRGHTIRLVTSYKGNDHENLHYYNVDKRNFIAFNNYITEKNGAIFSKPDEKVIREALNGCDVVHMFLPFKMAKLATKIAIELKVPMTSAFHCPPECITTHIGLKNSKKVNNAFYKWFDNKFYKYHQFIHCPSEFVKDEIQKRNYKADFRVASNGVDNLFCKFESQKPEEFKDKFVILTSGRYSGEKRHDLIIKAMSYSKYADKIQLIFAGKGPLEAQLKAMSKHLKNPILFKFYTKEELAKAINFSDLYIHAADAETEAIACLEAISCCVVPVISNSPKSATKQFALTENNLFEHGNPIDLAHKIDYWIEHPQEKEELSNQYEEFTKQFRIEACMDVMEKMFNDAIKYYKEKYNN